MRRAARQPRRHERSGATSGSRLALFVAPGLLVAMYGCRTAAPPPADPPSVHPEPVVTRPLPLPDLAAIPRAAGDLALWRCVYRVGAEERSLDCERSLADLSPPARAELTALLDSEAPPPLPAGSALPGAGPVRRYQLAARGRWILAVVLSEQPDGRTATAELRSGALGRSGSAATPRLLAELRAGSREVLAASRRPPRPSLPWQAPALASFLPGSGSESDRRLADELATHLLSLPPEPESATERALLAAALVPAASLLTPARASELLASDDPAAQVLGLVRDAAGGDAAALREVFTLADEHGGSLTVFVAASRALFAPTLDPELAARYPPELDATLGVRRLAELRLRLDSARYVAEARAWRLAPAPDSTPTPESHSARQ